MPVSTAIVGRQPVVDRADEIVGYELLFRPLPSSDRAYDPNAPRQLSGDEMTATVLYSALGIGIDHLTGGKTVFCNADRGVLTGDMPMSLPPKRTVIEVLETVVPDEDVLNGCRALRRAGYRLAADDFSDFSGSEALLDLVDIVKIDLQVVDVDDIPALMRRCREFDVQMLAEKIETPEELAVCRELDFDLFQGYLIGRPRTISGPSLVPCSRNVLRLASTVLDDDTEFSTIEDILQREPALSYQLLQLAAIGRLGETQRQVRSIREALVAMGLVRLRGWISTLMLRPSGKAIDTNLPAVLARARLAELLAEYVEPGSGAHAFTAGMISALDLLLGVPHAKLSAMLDLPDTLRTSAFSRGSTVGCLIADIVEHEQHGHPPHRVANLSDDVVVQASAQAFGWAMEATEVIDSLATV